MESLIKINLQGEQSARPFYLRKDSAADRGVFEQIFKNGDYDVGHFPQSVSLKGCYAALVKSKETALIIDAGSNIGASVVYFSLVWDQCKVFAIEPEPRNCELLKLNCSGLNYSLIEGAIGCRNGIRYLHDPGEGEWGYRVEDHGQQEVKGFAASDIVAEQINRGIRPFIFKIDIEGGEEDLFAEKTDWVQHFPLIVLESHDWLFPGLARSRNFLRTISGMNFDVVFRGENVFCFNNDLLAPYR